MHLLRAETAASTHNGTLLEKLNVKLPEIQKEILVTAVPVKDGIDIDSLRHEDRVQDEPSTEFEWNDGPGDDLESFAEIDKMTPENRQQQKCTVLLQGFPALKPQPMEKVLKRLLQREFKWSVVLNEKAVDEHDHKFVFVRFSKVKDAEWFGKNWARTKLSIPSLNAIFDTEVSSNGEAEGEADAEVRRILRNKANYGTVTTVGTQDLDEVLEYYKLYKVEPNDLVAVPREMREKIVRDIILFRFRLLTLERENRRKEDERERLLAKARVRQLFQGLTQSAEVEEETEGPMSHLNDEQYEKHLATIEKDALESAFQAELRAVKQTETGEKAKLVRQLKLALEYERSLVENKAEHMDDTRRSAEMRYTQQRAEFKQREEAADQMDIDDEASDAVEPQEIRIRLRSEGDSGLKQKVAELVEEYLGVAEEVLIDFIYNHIEQGGAKEDLVAELRETLDEDSEAVAGQLYEYIDK